MSAPTQEPRRDQELAALLQTHLDAPPLRPGFHEELEARLQATDAGGREAARAAAGPSAPEEPRRRRFAGRLLAVAAVAAAAAILVFAVLPALRGTATATAADMLAAMSSAAADVQTVRLDIRTVSTTDIPATSTRPDYSGRATHTAELTLSTTGDALASESSEQWWKTGAESRQSIPRYSRVSSYDARRHEVRSGPTEVRSGSTITGGRDRFAIRRPAWAVDLARNDLEGIGYSTLSACLRAQLAAIDPASPIETTTYLGRPGWRADLVERWPADSLRDADVVIHWDVIVDKATGLLMAATLSLGDGKGVTSPVTVAMRVTRLEPDPQLQDGWQLAPLPKKGLIAVIDEGTRFGTPEEVAERSWPTLPLIPQWAPVGYRLTDVASAGSGGGYGSGGEPSASDNAGNRLVGRSGRFLLRRASWAMPDRRVLVRFRRDFSTFVVEIDAKLGGEQLAGATERPSAEDVTLSSGYLKGARARTWIAPYQGEGPTLITFSERSRITIRGDLTRQELIDVANSMKVYGDVDKPIQLGSGLGQ